MITPDPVPASWDDCSEIVTVLGRTARAAAATVPEAAGEIADELESVDRCRPLSLETAAEDLSSPLATNAPTAPPTAALTSANPSAAPIRRRLNRPGRAGPPFDGTG
jgi:hypothetical protein